MGGCSICRTQRDRTRSRSPVRCPDRCTDIVEPRQRNEPCSVAETPRARPGDRRVRRKDAVEGDHWCQPAVRRDRRQEEARLSYRARGEPLRPDARHLSHAAHACRQRFCRMRGIPEKPKAEQELKKAHRLAWLSIAYIVSTIVLL